MSDSENLPRQRIQSTRSSNMSNSENLPRQSTQPTKPSNKSDSEDLPRQSTLSTKSSNMSDSENLPRQRQRTQSTRPSNRLHDHNPPPESKLPTRHMNQVWQSSMTYLLLAIWHTALAIMKLSLYLLIIPAAFALTILVALYFYRYVLVPTVCQVPGSAYVVPLCRSNIVTEDPYFENVIRQDRELAKMQMMAADNAALPLVLLLGGSDIKDLVFSLSEVDLPSKNKLMPLVREYSDLVEKIAEGIQDCLVSTDHLVDNVIITNTWTEYHLQAISDRETSIMAPVTRLLEMMKDMSIHSESIRNEAQLRSAFLDYTNRLQKQADITLAKYLKVQGPMSMLRDVLDTMAARFADEGSMLQLDEKKLGQSSYWKWLLKSHQHKIADFDKKVDLCAKFYNHSREGEKIVTVTILKLQEMRARISSLNKELENAARPLAFGSEASTSLQLSIDRLKASVKYLESSKQKSHEKRNQREIEFEREFAKAM